MAGQVRARYDYDLWGVRSANLVTLNAVEAGFGFTGQYVSTPYPDLAFAPFRIYSAKYARWLSRDPAGEQADINLYRYVKNDPVNYFDPDGTTAIVAVGAILVLAIAVGVLVTAAGRNMLDNAGLASGALLNELLNEIQGDGEEQAVDGEGKPCPAKDLSPTGEPPVDLPSTKKGNKVGRSVEESYTDSQWRPVTSARFMTGTAV